MAPRKKKRPPAKKKRPGRVRAVVPPEARPLQYKVVELSTVDEGTLERTANEWSARGWSLDGVQFAMRESSKRPAMAFVFFTRQGAPAAEDPVSARARLQEMSDLGSPTARLVGSPDFTGNAASSAQEYVYARPPGMVSAHERLAQLAGLDGAERPERGLILEPGPESEFELEPGE